MTGHASSTGHGRITACCGAFLLSCYVSVKGHTALAVVLTALSAVLVLLSILLRGRTRLAARILPVVCFIFAAALLSLLHRTFIELPSYSVTGDGVRISATVEEVNYYDYSMSALLRLKSADGKAVHGKLLLELEDFVSLSELDQVELVADISVYPERTSSLLAGSPNRSRDIFLSGTPSPDTQVNVTPAPPSLSLSLKGLRDGIQYILEENIWREGDYPSAQASLACGIFLGERDNISYAVRGDFNRTGISHILSVSGMHLTILMGTFFALLCALGIHRLAACVMVMAAALFYMALCGFIPSATRAGIMALFYYTALLFGRDSHAPSSLFMAGCAICAVNPYTVADVSFMLSFLATLGIVTVSPTLARISGVARDRSRLLVPFAALLSGFGITTAAVLFTLPVTLSVFGTLSLVSPVANLAAAPFVQLILVLSPLLALFSFLPFAAGLLSSVIYICCDILARIAHVLSEPDWVLVALSYPGLAVVTVFGVLSAFLPFYLRGKWRAVFASLFVLCVLLSGGIYIRGRAWDTAHPRVLYTVRDNEQQLILCGGRNGTDIVDLSDASLSQLYAISDAMIKNGDTCVSRLILTGLSPGHPAFFESMLERMPVRTLYLPLTQYTERDMSIKEKLENLAVLAGCDIMYYTSDIQTDCASLYISTIKVDGTVQTMAEADTGSLRLLYLTRGQPEAFSFELEGEYDGVILGTQGASLEGQKLLELKPRSFALYTTYNYQGTPLSPKFPSRLLKHLTDNNLPLYNASGAVYTRFVSEDGIIKVEMEYE